MKLWSRTRDPWTVLELRQYRIGLALVNIARAGSVDVASTNAMTIRDPIKSVGLVSVCPEVKVVGCLLHVYQQGPKSLVRK